MLCLYIIILSFMKFHKIAYQIILNCQYLNDLRVRVNDFGALPTLFYFLMAQYVIFKSRAINDTLPKQF